MKGSMLPINTAQARAAFQKARKLQQAGRLDAARVAYADLLKTLPDKAEVPYQLGRVELAAGNPGDAVRHLESARRMQPGESAILNALVQAHVADGDIPAAVAVIDGIIARAPGALKPRAEKARLLQQDGQFDAAARELRRALKRAPRDGELYRILMQTHTARPGDPVVKAMQAAWADDAVTGPGRAHLGFALAKAMRDLGRHDRVFAYLDPANAGMRAAQPFDLAARQAEVARMKHAQESLPLAPPPGDATAPQPVFVTGMPRSGTTLIEQILASHPQVTGGGELGRAVPLGLKLLDEGGKPDAARLARFANAYLTACRRSLRFDRVFTDKSIQPYMILGLLRAAVPNARFVVVERDPRDMLLSIYLNVFAPGTHRYGYDLADLARYYLSYADMIAHWRARMPEALTVVRYEDVVRAPEPHTRALVAAAGLDWDDACLAPHRTKRRVQTLSVAQVRQPIHSSAVGGWRRFESELAPMIGILRDGGALDAWD